MNTPKIIGTLVAIMPATKSLAPNCWKPCTKPGPDVMPTTATNAVSPTEVRNQCTGSGTRPNVGCTDRR
ncbi:hypothetical protein D3C71_1778320 [compost metagenome]